MIKKGDKICGYEIVEALGRGGLNHGFRAVSSDGKPVTIKIPAQELIGDMATYERFRREFTIGQELSHPAIPHAISFNETPEGPCIVLDYVDGVSLREYLQKNGSLTLDDALAIGRQLAEAVSYLHLHGVMHRDLKPENIIISNDKKIHIVDFGIALLQGARRVTWTVLSDSMGTPDYMAPEQIQGKRGDPRTDIYALGIILYEMLTGTVPFQGDNAMSVMHQHLTGEPVPPIRINNSIPPVMEKIILKCIRRDPRERYQSAAALLYDLEHFRDLDVAQFNLGPERKAGGAVTDRQIWTIGIAVAVGFVVLVGIIVIIALIMK
ncbi:MAG TPA: serine/threonine-protein kinase, partial [Dehalococcoidales bacterium]|nr:serine/threonine-protein kinase [Dehalococcoidales bacterium]